MDRARRFTLILAAAMLLASAHSRADALIAGAPWSQDRQSTEIVMTEYAFGPAEATISAGVYRVRIVNAGIRRHTMVVQVDGVEHASPEARPGQVVEWDLAIERPGRYLFWCGEYRHLEKGMVGALNVE